MAAAKKKKLPVKSATKKTAKPVKAAKKTAGLDIGSAVPDFEMPATKIGKVSRAALKGKPFVLYFYPKDDTPGCTVEACDFSSSLSAFSKLGLTVIGVSKDNMKKHENFSKKFKLSFPLASDEKAGVCESFGTWVEKSMYGRKYMGIERSTFLVDGKGIVRAVWRKVSVPGHVEDVKKAVKDL